VGPRKDAAPLAHRARERASHMPEQLALQHTLGEGPTALGHEGLVGAVGEPVQRPGHQLLARAGLAEHQDRERGGCDPSRSPRQLAHHGTVAHHVGEGAGQLGPERRHLSGQRPNLGEAGDVELHFADRVGMGVGHELRRNDLQHPHPGVCMAVEEAGLHHDHPDRLGLGRAGRQ
jgi:hypothetical protein